MGDLFAAPPRGERSRRRRGAPAWSFDEFACNSGQMFTSLDLHGGQKPSGIAASRFGTVAAGDCPMLQKLHREVMRMRFMRGFFSRTLGQLTGPSGPRGAAWRSISEFQACLVTHGHELLVEHHSSYMEEPQNLAGVIGAHEDVSPPMPVTRPA